MGEQGLGYSKERWPKHLPPRPFTKTVHTRLCQLTVLLQEREDGVGILTTDLAWRKKEDFSSYGLTFVPTSEFPWHDKLVPIFSPTAPAGLGELAQFRDFICET